MTENKRCGICKRAFPGRKLHSVCDLCDNDGVPIPYICTSCYQELLGCIWREERRKEKEASDRAKLRAWPPDIPDCENPVPLIGEEVNE